MQQNVTEVLGELLTKIRSAQRNLSVMRDELQQDEAIMQLLTLSDKLLKIEASITSELPKTKKTIDKLIVSKKRPGRPKAKLTEKIITPRKTAKKTIKKAIKKPAIKVKPAPKKRGRRPMVASEKVTKTAKKPMRRGRATSKKYTENWIIGYSILNIISMLKGEQTPRFIIYAIDKVLKQILSKDDRGESKAAKQRGYEGVWATHLSDSIHRERRTLVEAGFIDKKAPTGIWRITAKGNMALKNTQLLKSIYHSFESDRISKISKILTSAHNEIVKYASDFEKKSIKTRGTKVKSTKGRTAKAKVTKAKVARKAPAKKAPAKKAPVKKAPAIGKKRGRRPGGIKKKLDTKLASKSVVKRKPGRQPKAAKAKVVKAKGVKAKTTTKKTSDSKTPEKKTPVEKAPATKMSAIQTPVIESSTIKAPVTNKKRGRKPGSILEKKINKPLSEMLLKRKPGRPSMTEKKNKKQQLISKIEQRMKLKDKSIKRADSVIELKKAIAASEPKVSLSTPEQQASQNNAKPE